MFASLEYTVGNDSYRGDWCLIYDDAQRKAHASYPPPTSTPRKRVRRGLQIFLHRVLIHTFQDLCPAILSNCLSTAKYDAPDLQDADGHPYCIGTHLLQAIETYSVPTDDTSSMNVQAKFERQLSSFPGITSAASFKKTETWAHITASEWNRLSPYYETMRASLPRYIQMLHQQLLARTMADKQDKIA
jgi:hypothetical protein